LAIPPPVVRGHTDSTLRAVIRLDRARLRSPAKESIGAKPQSSTRRYKKCSARQKLRFPLQLLSAPPSRRQPRPSIIASPMFIRQFTTWSPPPFVTAARRLVVHLAVAIARGLALVHHQIAGDESFLTGRPATCWRPSARTAAAVARRTGSSRDSRGSRNGSSRTSSTSCGHSSGRRTCVPGKPAPVLVIPWTATDRRFRTTFAAGTESIVCDRRT
jgi:hypothetical protein